MDSSPLAARLTLQKPPLLSLLGQRALRRFAESKMSGQLEDSLSEFFNLAGKRLEQWHKDALAELREAFDTRAGVYRAQFEPLSDATTGESDIQKDLDVLKKWKT